MLNTCKSLRSLRNPRTIAVLSSLLFFFAIAGNTYNLNKLRGVEKRQDRLTQQLRAETQARFAERALAIQALQREDARHIKLIKQLQKIAKNHPEIFTGTSFAALTASGGAAQGNGSPPARKKAKAPSKHTRGGSTKASSTPSPIKNPFALPLPVPTPRVPQISRLLK